MKSKLTAVTLLLFGALALSSTPASARPEPLIISEDSRAGPRPGKTPFGTYAALDLSMRNGSVTTINRDTVLNYGQPRLVRFQGRDYWRVPVTYRHRIFGNGVIISEAQALVRFGQVEHWVFPKSSLQVP